MAGNCDDCGFCFLIDEDCLCLHTPLYGIPVKEMSSAVIAANQTLRKVTGTCDLCDKDSDYDAILDSGEFKQYYSNLIYKFWIMIYGSGRPSREGLVSKASDEFSELRIHSNKEAKDKASFVNDLLEMYEEPFMTKLKELYPHCIECQEEKEPVCGCGKTPCGCHSSCDDDFELSDSAVV